MSEPVTDAKLDAKDSKKKLPWHKRLVKEWVIPILSVLAVLLPLRSVVADWYDVPTGSMEPTILPGDRILANKLAFGLRVPLVFRIWPLAIAGLLAGTMWVAVCARPRGLSNRAQLTTIVPFIPKPA